MHTLRAAVILLAFSVQAAAAQTTPDPLAVVQRLFDAMRAQDTAAMRSTLDVNARLLSTGTNQQGQPVARSFPIDGWLRAIAGAPATPDERLYQPQVRIDQNLATVWTRYELYVGENFSHCGYDSFFLVQVAGAWKIVQVADTQQRSADRCGRATVPAASNPASPSDTAAVVAALQRVFDGMRSRDTTTIADAFAPDATLLGLQTDRVSPAPIGAWMQSLTRLPADQQIVERMVLPEVQISDNLATVWTWYDVHLGERFSHCGIDAAQVVRTAAGWKVAHIAYTTRRSPCEPPRQD